MLYYLGVGGKKLEETILKIISSNQIKVNIHSLQGARHLNVVCLANYLIVPFAAKNVSA